MLDYDHLMMEAETFLNARNPAKAIEFALLALEVQPTSENANLILAIAYQLLDDMENALKYFELSINEVKKRPGAFMDYATALSFFDRNDEALKVYADVVKTYPDFKEAYFNYGHCLLIVQKWADALIMFDKAEALGVATAQLYNDRGGAKFNMRMYYGAEIDLLKAIELDPEDHESSYLLAEIYSDEEDWENAVLHYSHSLYFNPDNSRALSERFLARLHIKDEQGKVVNREGAQADADKIIALGITFMEATSKEGKPLKIVGYRVEEDGTLTCLVDQSEQKA